MVDPFEDPAYNAEFAAGVMPGPMRNNLGMRLRRAEEFRALLRDPAKLNRSSTLGTSGASDPQNGLCFLLNQQLAVGVSFTSLLWELGHTGGTPTGDLLVKAYDVVAGRAKFVPTGRHPL